MNQLKQKHIEIKDDRKKCMNSTSLSHVKMRRSLGPYYPGNRINVI
jgi:hypothetical protein